MPHCLHTLPWPRAPAPSRCLRFPTTILVPHGQTLQSRSQEGWSKRTRELRLLLGAWHGAAVTGPPRAGPSLRPLPSTGERGKALAISLTTTPLSPVPRGTPGGGQGWPHEVRPCASVSPRQGTWLQAVPSSQQLTAPQERSQSTGSLATWVAIIFKPD